jgi:hypothetical protein
MCLIYQYCHIHFVLQFGAAVFNVKELTKFASERTQELVELEMKALMSDVRYKLICNSIICLSLSENSRSHENLKRGMLNAGTLVKSVLGKQTVNGVLTQKEIEVPTLGPNPRRATIDKFGVLSSLRINIQQARPGEISFSWIVTFLTTLTSLAGL